MAGAADAAGTSHDATICICNICILQNSSATNTTLPPSVREEVFKAKSSAWPNTLMITMHAYKAYAIKICKVKTNFNESHSRYI